MQSAATLSAFKTNQGPNIPRILLVIFSLLGIGIGIYMTKHFFDVRFLSDLNSADSLCNLNSYFNCDKATKSNMAAIFHVPIALLGLILYVFFFIGALFPSVDRDRTNYFLSLINFLGCLGLFLYSLIVLGGLCPMCTLYYILSFFIFVIHFRFGGKKLTPHFGTLGMYGLITFFVAGLTAYKVEGKVDETTKLQKKITEQFFSLPAVGDPVVENPFFLKKLNQDFSKAPLRLSIFSDFECPSCKGFSEELPAILKRYPNTLSVQYLFFPLDQQCNSIMKNPMHLHACNLAYLSVCQKEKFSSVHDELFQAQGKVDEQWLKDQVNSKKLTACFNDPKTKEEVVKIIAIGQTYSIEGTPTIILNGVKLPAPPAQFLVMILDEILKRQGITTP